MYKESDSIREVPGVGEVAQAALERLGIFCIGDLLRWYPRTYLDASNPVPVARVPYGQLCAVDVTVESHHIRKTKNRGVPMLEAKCFDDSGEILVRWFNQPFLKTKLRPGTRWVFIGVANRFQGETVMLSPIIEETPQIMAIYALTKGVTSRMLRGFTDWILKRVELGSGLFPEEIRSSESLISRGEAMHYIHHPSVMSQVELARQRVSFEEVFWFFVRMAANKHAVEKEAGIPISPDADYLKDLVEQLPFELTHGQKRAVWDSLQDMTSGPPMTRLLNGDVGSGKTVVAALIAAAVAKSGYQSVLLVPTEILAKQHQASIQKLLQPFGITVALWTAAQKDSLEAADIVVGTHAVLQEKFELPRLGFVVIDEQHRFGVRQRMLLRSKSSMPPHILSMTATPIPRTLALALYGDLTVSLLPEKPKDRLPITTKVIHKRERREMHERIVTELAAGHQVFVICPLIEEKKKEPAADEGATLFDSSEIEAREKKTVLAEVDRLRSEFPEYGVIEAVHGKMKADQKREIMQRMANGEINVLVATSVIEVGVDIPNATVMIIEGAERFGLAQLHQFRGRVGRGKDQSYCFLCPDLQSAEIEERLQVLARTESGFEIAEADLQLRGPGELVGQVQSGLPDFRMASLTDVEFLQHVKEVVQDYVQKNPEFLEMAREMTYSKTTGGLE